MAFSSMQPTKYPSPHLPVVKNMKDYYRDGVCLICLLCFMEEDPKKKSHSKETKTWFLVSGDMKLELQLSHNASDKTLMVKCFTTEYSFINPQAA